MSEIIESFGKYIYKTTKKHPIYSRHILSSAFFLYKYKQHFFADKRLPKSKQYSAKYVAKVVSKMLSNPKKSALVSAFMPCEILNAFGIIPMCAELYSTYLSGACAESIFSETAKYNSVPETFCSYHKILLGGAFSKVLDKPEFIANTSMICDANNITFKELAKFYDIPHFYLDVPSLRNQESVKFVSEQLIQLTDFIEKVTGRKFDNSKFIKSIGLSKKTIELKKECYGLNQLKTLSNTMTSELYEFYIMHNALGTENAYHYFKLKSDDLNQSQKTNAIRLLWVHTMPFWQNSAQKLLNFNPKYQIISCDINNDMIEVDTNCENPYEFMAQRLVYSSLNGGEERIKSILKQAKDIKADGVVCFCHWGCKQTIGLSASIKKQLENEGFPTLILNGDGCDRKNSSDGQISTRLSAFIEILERNKND